MGIKYTKLPNALDVDKLIRQKVREVYGCCPYCASRSTVSKFCDVDSGSYDFDTTRMTLGGHSSSFDDNERFTWARAKFRCRKCGGEWESDYYPIRLSTSPRYWVFLRGSFIKTGNRPCQGETRIVSVTLLSIDEYKAAQEHIPPLDESWWLRSPGRFGFRAACVTPGGLNPYGDLVDDHVAVRPALRLDPQSVHPEGLKTGDKFRFGGKLWTYISEGLALSDEAFCRMPFREDWKADDANVYEASDVKAYLDGWPEEMHANAASQKGKIPTPVSANDILNKTE